ETTNLAGMFILCFKKTIMSKHTLLYILGSLFLAASVLTIIPGSGTGPLNFLGYRAIFPFAPVSTLLCLGMAVCLFIMIRNNTHAGYE
ncbi:hypothetical protein ACFL20_12395, partial [Spirochaetota bacterium]